jgi:hypothetical protein
MTTPRALALLLALLATAPLAGPAGRTGAPAGRARHDIEGSIPPPATAVRIETDLGAVRVHGDRSGEVRYRIRVRPTGAAGDEAAARRLLDDLVISVSRDGDRILFRGAAHGDRSALIAGLAARFDLSVPEQLASLEVVSGAGDVEVEGLAGEVTLLTEAGNLTARGLGGPLRAETHAGSIRTSALGAAARLITAGGEVRVESVRGDLVAQTSGGDVRIDRAGGAVRAETGGGNMWVDEAGGDVTVATSGGGIVVGRAAGRVSAASAGGGIRVGSAGGGVHCETAAGPIDLGTVVGAVHAITSAGSIRAALADGGGRPSAESDLETWQGDVVVSLPESMPLTIRALVDNPVGHPIRSDFPLTISRDTESAGRPMEIAEGTVGGGGSVLRIRTLGGRIVILKAGDKP